MICPHCKKAIQKNKVPDETIRMAKQLKREGYSLRDIAEILTAQGHPVTFSTLSRRLAK